MRDEKLYLNRCPITNKVCFDKRDAQTKRNWLQKEGREKAMRIYPCPDCEYWHITHVIKKSHNQIIKES